MELTIMDEKFHVSLYLNENVAWKVVLKLILLPMFTY